MTIHRSRRRVLKAIAATAAVAAIPTRFAIGQAAKIKLGLMLPYTGTYAALGKNIDDALRLAIAEGGGKLGGRDIEYAVVDDESEPAKATENATKLVSRDKVDILIGTVHSGVAAAMVKVAADNNTLLVIPNAGVGAATGPLCAPNIFRTSFSNWTRRLRGARDLSPARHLVLHLHADRVPGGCLSAQGHRIPRGALSALRDFLPALDRGADLAPQGDHAAVRAGSNLSA